MIFLSLFYFFGGDGNDRAGLGGGYIPRRYTPAHSSAPGRWPRRANRTGGAETWSVSGKVYNFGRYIYTHLYLYFLRKALDCSDINDII